MRSPVMPFPGCPVRLGVPAEIAVITLKRGPGGA